MHVLFICLVLSRGLNPIKMEGKVVDKNKNICLCAFFALVHFPHSEGGKRFIL